MSENRGPLTDEEKVKLKIHSDKWVAVALKTGVGDRREIHQACIELYKTAGLEPPSVVIVPDPIIMANAAGAAAWIWHQRSEGKNDPVCLTNIPNTVGDMVLQAVQGAINGYSGSLCVVQPTLGKVAQNAPKQALDACREIAGEGGVECATNWRDMFQAGNLGASWIAYLTAYRDVLGMNLPEAEKFAAYERLAMVSGFRMVHDKFAIICDLPEIIAKDDQNLPHSTTGPSHLWRSGWALYHVHGVRVPEYVIMHPEQITVDDIEGEENAEVRRIKIDRYGPERFIRDSGARVVDERPDDFKFVGLRGAKLLVKDIDDDEPMVYVDLLNSTPEPDGTVKRYLLRVDPNAYNGRAAKDCLAAVASTWRDSDGNFVFARPEDYDPEIET
jgi:hypothetical protein